MITPEMIDGKNPEEIVQLLKENCLRTEVQQVKKHFSEDELLEFRSELAEESINRNDAQDRLKSLTAGLRLEIGQFTKNIKTLLKNLKQKYVEQEDTVYLFDDQEAGIMITYSSTGDIVDTRRLLPSEKQTRIRDIKKTA